ncbi:hypothetical protein OMAG_001263 [Candidatus Omnitrophus magneticus]|uniref:Polysaccharide deacetylase n=1 Tax=Candidatus Omnitrophus magneticus TaxID=1609969 RepID=A0A0F0CTL6_9BACT|nr:hypothetical protein OMAG_001367 [Candidatus Omnitrophus magneticus]KJJ84870.1 hypothetical protein OMAG_001263 [Candidatus Omnitrophus magneticus]
MLQIIISIDYEIFGQGAGNVSDHMINPVKKLSRIAGRYNVPFSLMFEAVEFMKFEEFARDIRKDLEFSPHELIKEQIIECARKGHDIQLHIHPQWIDALYKRKKWEIPNPSRVVEDMDEKSIYKMISSAKQKIENIITPINPNYICNTARFTGYNWSEAHKKTHKILKQLGIKAHSLADYCPIENKIGYWELVKGLELFEIPIYSIVMPKYKMFTWRKLFSAAYMQSMVRTNRITKKIKDEVISKKYSILEGLFKDVYTQKWDLCKQSSGEMLKFLELAFKRFDYKKESIPLVMIGHSKDFLFPSDFDKFLETVTRRYIPTGDVKFTTFQDFVKWHL